MASGIRNRIVDHVTIKGCDLQDNKGNWRVHPQMQRDALNGILAEVGIVDELLVYESERQGGLTILDGHLRAGEHPDVEWPCTVLDLTDEEADLVLATFDPMAAMAQMSARAMEKLIAEVRPSVVEPSILDMLDGLAEQAQLALAEIETAETGEAPEAQLDRASELQEVWQVERGQIWQCGNHRLMCGDSTNGDDIGRLMGDDKAVLCHADPPYGMGKEKEGIVNDNLYREKLDTFQMAWWLAWRPFLEDNASAYIWGNAEDLWRLWFVGGLRDSERLTFRNEIVWDKGDAGAAGVSHQGAEGFRMYPRASERAFFFMLGEQGFNINADNYWEGWEPIRLYLLGERQKMGWDVPTMKRVVGHSDLSRDHWTSKSQWNFPTREVYEKLQAAAKNDAFKREYDALKREYDDLKREFYATRAYFDNTHDNMTDVWQFPRVSGDERHEHPSPKPVALVERAIKSSAPVDMIVAVPFCGAGAAIVASESTKRIARAMDIEPKWCAVSLQRLADMGLEPKLLQ